VVQKSFSIGVYHFQGGCDNCYDNGGKIENLLFLAAVQNSFYKILFIKILKFMETQTIL